MIKVNKLKKFFILFLIVFVCMGVLTFYNTQTAFADVNSEQSSGELSEKDYEDSANEDRLSRTTGDPDTCEVIMRGFSCFDSTAKLNSVWHVTKKSDKTCCDMFRTIHTYIDDVDYPFDYDIRGYFGDRSNVLHRTAQVQFFYNTKTKTLRVLCFGDGADGHKFHTYSYGGGTTILNDALKVCKGVDDDPVNGISVVKQWTISDEVKYIEIDPLLEKILEESFKSCLTLEKVDIIGEKYEKSQLKYLGCCSFANCGNSNNQFYQEKNFVALQIFNIYDKKPGQLTWSPDYNKGTYTLYYKQ